MGALGTHLAEGLVRAGINKLTIVDRDYIEFSNLQRQTLFIERDAEDVLPKVIAAQKVLKEIRKDVEIDAYIEHVNYNFLEQHGKDVDIILDATDNFDTRELINDFAYKHQIPWIYGGVVQSTYVQATFIPGQTPCFNCLMPQLPSINLTCDTVGVIQPAVTMTTSLQLSDALKLLTGNKVNTHFTYGDIWEGIIIHLVLVVCKMKIVKHVVMLQHIHTLININKITRPYVEETLFNIKMLIFLRKYYYHFSSEIIFNIVRIYI